jgi:hypothetical protein
VRPVSGLVPALCALFVVAACGDAHVVAPPGIVAESAPSSTPRAVASGAGAASGRTWTSLDTHCGVLSARVDGKLWIADPPIGDHHPPPGWGENETSGFFIAGTGRAVFRGEGGQVALFRRARPSEPDPLASCE